MRKAIHSIKNGVAHPGNPDVTIDTDSGDVYINGEYIGNVLDELEWMGLL